MNSCRTEKGDGGGLVKYLGQAGQSEPAAAISPSAADFSRDCRSNTHGMLQHLFRAARRGNWQPTAAPPQRAAASAAGAVSKLYKSRCGLRPRTRPSASMPCTVDNSFRFCGTELQNSTLTGAAAECMTRFVYIVPRRLERGEGPLPPRAHKCERALP